MTVVPGSFRQAESPVPHACHAEALTVLGRTRVHTNPSYCVVHTATPENENEPAACCETSLSGLSPLAASFFTLHWLVRYNSGGDGEGLRFDTFITKFYAWRVVLNGHRNELLQHTLD